MPLPPMVSACVLSLTIGCASNIIAQRLKAYMEDVPFVFDYALFYQLTAMGLITTPINYYWQKWLEHMFPGEKLVKRTRAPTSDDAEKGAFIRDDDENKRALDEDVFVRSWGNVVKKTIADSMTGGALLNTTMFLVLLGLMQGKTAAQIVNDIRDEELTIIWDSYKIWPLANLFSFAYVPVERRIVFLSFFGLLWSIYMTLVASRLSA
ncbi:integral membrane protein-like protein [Karstenula rhodostoma CBS 690.94]|uniref:Integral membrane protein-like protein n=1 Tax=Karstenula rhodostoma CBS 690.94 TaxID=1392251 RepID=A0A9P4PNB7_9PLEO|nr:integral membrane protein-like protein [Karstenula rhodostoma CBS 690.94]